jgi:hypothetical protein
MCSPWRTVIRGRHFLLQWIVSKEEGILPRVM